MLILLTCLYALIEVRQSGLSRYRAEQAVAAADINLASQAVRTNPIDPEAYYARGIVLSERNRIADAMQDFESAAQLRAHDYQTWLHLGLSYQARGNFGGAVDALTRSVRLAPYYAQPRWSLGNALLLNGKHEEGLRQLSTAAKSDPSLLPEAIQKTWKAYEGNPLQVEDVINPENTVARFALASFFVFHSETDAALPLLRQIGSEGTALKYALTIQLAESSRYRDAAEVWKTAGNQVQAGLVNDGGFEQGEISQSIGFWWQDTRESRNTRIRVSRRSDGSGNSLTLTFNGADEATEFVRQLLVISPQTRYSLSFNMRADLSADAPAVVIRDAAPQGPILATSKLDASNANAWQSSAVEFETTKDTQAIFIAISQPSCPATPCTLVGTVELDNFLLIPR